MGNFLDLFRKRQKRVIESEPKPYGITYKDICSNFEPIMPKWMTYGDYTFDTRQITAIGKRENGKADIFTIDHRQIMTDIYFDDLIKALCIYPADLREFVKKHRPAYVSKTDIDDNKYSKGDETNRTI